MLTQGSGMLTQEVIRDDNCKSFVALKVLLVLKLFLFFSSQ